MFRHSFNKILNANLLANFNVIRNYSASTVATSKARRRKKKPAFKILSKQEKNSAKSISIYNQIHSKPLNEKELASLLLQLKKMKSFELKIVTTTIYLKFDNN
jgi:hypothetical protein